jgi:hypothetical protein
MKLNFKSISYNSRYQSIIHFLLVLLVFCIIYTLFFSPILFSKKLLAPGDGIVQSVPAFYSPRTLWTPLLLSGFPVAADVTPQTWYPVSVLFSLIPDSWNAFVVSAYVLASIFSYGYVYTLTKSRLAAMTSGIIYGMSGFMMAHLGHTSMIHTAAWMPLLIWTLEKLRHKSNFFWLVTGVCAVACSFLAGHPQIFVYSIGLSTAYALILGWLAPIGRRKYYRLYLAVLLLGLALAAIQLIPTIELANLSKRSSITIEEFFTFSLPLYQTIQLIFPYLFGTHHPSPYSLYKPPYLGEWNLTELVGYIGLLPLMLGAIGLLSNSNKSVKLFWLSVGLFTLLLTLGNATPLGQLMYYLPAYNKFRAPARHFVEVALAVSVLAGLGIATLQKQVVSNRLLLKTILVSSGVILGSGVGIFWFASQLQTKAIKAGVEQLSLLPWLNPAVGLPLVIFSLAAATLIYWSKSIQSNFRGLCILLILVLDLGSFGWFYEWQYISPNKDSITPTVSTQKYKEVLNASQQRMLPIQGALGSVDEIPPNVSRLWGVPNASGYGPFILSRYSQLLSMLPEGTVSNTLLDGVDQSLDITSTRYVFLPRSVAESVGITGDSGNSQLGENLNITLGSGCGVQQRNSIKLPVSSQPSANAISIVSSLGCATGISNNAEVLRILVTDTTGKVAAQSLLAGRHTSEWSHSCSDVHPYVQHQQAPIFESFPVVRESVPTCEGHTYVSTLALAQLSNIKSVDLQWVGSLGAIKIQKVSLINNKSKQIYPINKISSLQTDKTRWSHIEDIEATSVYENLRAMPRAWLVPEVIRAKPDEILNSIKSSQLPDGSYFEASKVALVEEPLTFKVKNLDAGNSAKIVKSTNTNIEVKVSSSSPAFLILSDTYYPGWEAKIDDKRTHIFQTNYVLRGVLIPSGTHLVKFEFKSMSFHIGAGISIASLALLGYLSWQLRQNQKPLITN